MARKPDLRNLAIAEALSKALRPMLDTRSNSLRSDADDYLRERYEDEGVDRIRLIVNKKQVGTLSAKVSKAIDTVEPVIDDDAAFATWLRLSDGGQDTIRRLLTDGKTRKLLLKAATADGELPDGCVMRKVVEPPRFTGTMLKIDAQKVAEAMGAELPGAVAGLLGGGANGD